MDKYNIELDSFLPKKLSKQEAKLKKALKKEPSKLHGENTLDDDMGRITAKCYGGRSQGFVKFGTLNLKFCNHCPAYKWHGETTSSGDLGCYCQFGAFNHHDYSMEKQIPPNCPIREMRDQLKARSARNVGFKVQRVV